MNNTLHTPGPWKCDLVSLKIWANDGNAEIAQTSSDVSIHEEEANAHLISAAPDLLSAARNAANVLAALATGQLAAIHPDSNTLQELRAAIAKAKGAA